MNPYILIDEYPITHNPMDIFRKPKAVISRALRPRRYDNPDGFLISSTRSLTYGHVKAERLRVKNQRRAANNLPPIPSYHLI
jgi:hypothetical protein